MRPWPGLDRIRQDGHRGRHHAAARSVRREGVRGEKGIEVTWNAEADFESGIRNFIVLRDGQELASVPEKPAGQFGRPLFQVDDLPRHTLAADAEMRYLDTSAKAGEEHAYGVIAVNSVD